MKGGIATVDQPSINTYMNQMRFERQKHSHDVVG